MNLSPIGLGTFAFSNVFSSVDQDTATAIVEAHLHGGGNYIETAPIYPRNAVDLAGVLKSIPRADYKLGTKCCIAVEDGQKILSGKRDFIRRQLEGELNRLGLDYVDLLQTHATPPDEDPAKIAQTLSELKDEGLISSVGVSNCTLAELEKFCEGGEIEWVQIRLSMVHRLDYLDIKSFCLAKDIKLNPYQLIERGQLLPADRSRARREGDIRNMKPEYTGVADELVRTWFAQLAATMEKDFDIPPAALAIAWALQQDAIGCAVLGATSARQVWENWLASKVILPPGATEAIEQMTIDLEYIAIEQYQQELESLRGLVK